MTGVRRRRRVRWAGLERPLSYYALGKTAGLLYLTTFCLAATRCLDPGGGPAVLRALAAGGWSAVIGLVAFAASMAGVETQLVAYGRLCSTMLGDPNVYCSLRVRERDGMQSLTMAHAARHLLGTAAPRAPEQARGTACGQESTACH